MSSQEVKFEGSLEIKQVISYLEDLVKGLKDGKICVQEHDRFVALSPTEVIRMEIEAERKKSSESLAIELSWTQKPLSSDGQAPLKISVEAPPVSAQIKMEKEEKIKDEKKKDKEDKKDKKDKKYDKKPDDKDHQERDQKDNQDKKDKKDKKEKENKKVEKVEKVEKELKAAELPKKRGRKKKFVM